MNIFQHGKEQQIFGWEDLIERTLCNTHRFRELFHRCFPNPNGHGTTQRFV